MILLALTLSLGCAPAPPPPTPLELARERPAPPPARARVGVQLRSDRLGLGASPDGVLIVDGSRAHLGLLGPLGTPRSAVHVDGLGVAVRAHRRRHQVVALDAERVLREATGGVIGLQGLVGLLVGRLPQGLPVVAELVEPGGSRVLLDGGDGLRVAVELTARGEPRSLAVTDVRGERLLWAAWEPFADALDTRLPTGIALEVPELELELELRVRGWDAPGPAGEAFSLRTPEGWTVESAESAGWRVAETAVQAALGAALDPDGASDTMGPQEDR